MKRTIPLLFCCLVCLCTAAQSQHYFSMKDTTKSYVRLLFAGDAMQHSTQYKWAWVERTKSYNYEPNFRYIRPYLADADINIVNLETTLSGKPYGGYPRFRTPDAYFYALVDAGFQVFSLANNHICDGMPNCSKVLSAIVTVVSGIRKMVASILSVYGILPIMKTPLLFCFPARQSSLNQTVMIA